MPREEIYYSDKYTDDTFEYRHVIVPKKIARQGLYSVSGCLSQNDLRMPTNSISQDDSQDPKYIGNFRSMIPKTHTMSEAEWRGLGVQQSLGWVSRLR